MWTGKYANGNRNDGDGSLRSVGLLSRSLLSQFVSALGLILLLLQGTAP